MGEVKHSGVYQAAIDTWGAEFQLGKLREEMLELMLAMEQHKQGRVRIEAVEDELADVYIMVAQARLIMGCERVDDCIVRKLARLERKIAAERSRGKTR